MTSAADSSRETEAHPEATDSDLLRVHLAGAATAFELLHRRHHELVWRTCRRLVPAAEEAAVQAVFLVLLRQAARIQHHPCLPAWLVTTADLTCRTAERDRRRRQRGHEPLPVAELAAPPESTREDAQLDEVFSAVTASLSALNARQQAVVVRHLMQGEPQATLAEEFGVAVGTIASDLSRALARLRRMLGRRGLTVSALSLGLACHAEAEAIVLPISSATPSPSPQALALAHQVDTTMRHRRLLRHLGWAFALLGCHASGGVAVELATQRSHPCRRRRQSPSAWWTWTDRVTVSPVPPMPARAGTGRHPHSNSSGYWSRLAVSNWGTA